MSSLVWYPCCWFDACVNPLIKKLQQWTYYINSVKLAQILFVTGLCRFQWRRNGKFFNVGKDPRVTMRTRSGTLEFRSSGKPEDYEGEYQCFASNDFGTAISNKILLRVSSEGWFTVMSKHNMHLMQTVCKRIVYSVIMYQSPSSCFKPIGLLLWLWFTIYFM